jgi:hypothetical protein
MEILWRLTLGGQQFTVTLGKEQDPISKTPRTKWIGGVVQAVEHLLCKSKALNSNPNPTKKQTTTKTKTQQDLNGSCL